MCIYIYIYIYIYISVHLRLFDSSSLIFASRSFSCCFFVWFIGALLSVSPDFYIYVRSPFLFHMFSVPPDFYIYSP